MNLKIDLSQKSLGQNVLSCLERNFELHDFLYRALCYDCGMLTNKMHTVYVNVLIKFCVSSVLQVLDCLYKFHIVGPQAHIRPRRSPVSSHVSTLPLFLEDTFY